MKNFRSIAALLAACLPFVAAAQYHDAELFEAKGPVQKISVKYTRPGATFLDFYSFSSTGELTETKFGPVLQIERDAQGRISKYVYDTFDSSYYNIEYDDKGRVASQGTLREATEFHYGSNGQISEAHYIDCAYEITTNVEKRGLPTSSCEMRDSKKLVSVISITRRLKSRKLLRLYP